MKFNRKQINIHIVFILALVFANVINSKQCGNSMPDAGDKTWCWTKSMVNEPSFILNPKTGGVNWGYCQKEQTTSSIKYIAVVSTSQREKSETNSLIKIQIFGSKARTQEKILSSIGFERGVEKTIEFEANDVGMVSKIILKAEGNQGYRCRNIELRIGNMSKNFECLRRLEPCRGSTDGSHNCNLELYADGDTPYELTVKTSDDEGAGTNSPILIRLKGTNGETRPKLLSDVGLTKGSSETVTINAHDVGEITGFTMTLTETGIWKPIFLSVTNLINGAVKNFELINANLVSPGTENFSIDQGERPKENNTDNKTDSSSESENSQHNEERNVLNVHNPDGGLIEQKEKSTIIDLSCEQELVNPSADRILFGPDYPTKSLNYNRVLARCPSDCHKMPGTVYGLGIHPDKSPICLSALLDRAVSLYGGIISISIFPGLESYKIPNKAPLFPGISLKSLTSNSVMKSYVVAKVDNVDLVDRDLRILDHKGLLASEGRLELRVEGVWGSICSIGNSPESAQVICKNLGYKGGEWKSPTDHSTRNFCRDYKGFDYCAAEMSKIHFTKIECTESDRHINTCNKKIANLKVCSHDFDAIINCFNENYEKEIPTPVGVVRLDGLVRDKEDVKGRLEMYNEQKFSPVCDLGFNEDSATIACRQMGYDKGSQIVDQNISSPFKLEENSSEKFAASEVECKGGEKNLKECRTKMKEINCRHDHDVVLSCHGSRGDPSGKSQYKPKVMTLPPELSKLGISRKRIKCATEGNDPFFRGDPGSIFLVECPALCAKGPGTITGTGIYTSDSNVCLAAVHAGVIENTKGGLFAVVKTFGQSNFAASSNYGIISTRLTLPWNGAFTVSSVNSGWRNMNKLHEDGLHPDFLLKGTFKTSFLALNEDERDNSSNFDSSIPKPVFQFVQPNPDFTFDERKNFLIDSHKLSRVSTYSILTKFKMTKFVNKKAFIFSYSGCGGFNVLIDKEDSLVIGDMCDPSRRVDTKMMIPLNEMITLFLTYENSNINLILKSEKLGIVRRHIQTQAEIPNGDAVGIGRLARAKKEFFIGEIEFFNIYDTVLDEKVISPIIENVKSSASPVERKKTEDGRDCVSPCIDGRAGEGHAPKAAEFDADDINMGSVPKSTSLDNKNSIFHLEKGEVNPISVHTYGTYNKDESNTQETLRLDCSVNFTDKRFAGHVGKFFRVNCPNCSKERGTVYGTGVYHPFSSICKAATHSGLIRKEGDVIVEVTGPKPFFLGSTGKDRTISASFSKSENSFLLRVAVEHTKIPCERTAGEDTFANAQIGKKFAVICPADCSKARNVSIYGSEVYSDNSSICLAAVHFGVSSDKGGEVEFLIEGEQSSFKSTKGFGVVSKSKDYYVRSFRFLGTKSAISYNFTEDYQGKLNEKWEVKIDNNAIDKTKDMWIYKKEERKNLIGVIENFNTILHRGTVRMPDEGYASWITLKAADFANGVIKFNLKFVDLHAVALLFRYVDSENYYGIGFDLINKSWNVKLFTKINSNFKIIESKFLRMLAPEVWLRCTLIINFEEVQFLVQKEGVREHKLVFAKTLSDIHRGSLALATNGNDYFYLSGLQIKNYQTKAEAKAFSQTNKSRTFEDLMKKTTFKDIKKFCNSIYDKISNNFERCVEPHSFCQIKCNSLVPATQEGILNLKCLRDCVKTVYANNSDKLKDSVFGKESYVPKVGDKVDFLKNGEVYFLPGVVRSVSMRMKKKVLKIEYQTNLGEEQTSEVTWPTTNVTKCGEKLSKRVDCLLKVEKII